MACLHAAGGTIDYPSQGTNMGLDRYIFLLQATACHRGQRRRWFRHVVIVICRCKMPRAFVLLYDAKIALSCSRQAHATQHAQALHTAWTTCRSSMPA